MATRTQLPNWPAMMRRDLAAKYCDMTPTEFEGEIASQRLPLPVKLGSAERWHKQSLDDALARLVGNDEAAPDWRSGCKLYAS